MILGDQDPLTLSAISISSTMVCTTSFSERWNGDWAKKSSSYVYQNLTRHIQRQFYYFLKTNWFKTVLAAWYRLFNMLSDTLVPQPPHQAQPWGAQQLQIMSLKNWYGGSLYTFFLKINWFKRVSRWSWCFRTPSATSTSTTMASTASTSSSKIEMTHFYMLFFKDKSIKNGLSKVQGDQDALRHPQQPHQVQQVPVMFTKNWHGTFWDPIIQRKIDFKWFLGDQESLGHPQRPCQPQPFLVNISDTCCTPHGRAWRGRWGCFREHLDHPV